MAESLKKKTASALIWSLVDRGGQQIIQLAFMLILARLLTKDDFGLTAVLAIFTAIASLLQESGFSSALIRKKEVTQEEYTSVFYFNISVSIIMYALLFFFAPYIADYYDKPILAPLARFMFLAFLINSFGIVQNVNLVRNLDFKKNTQITISAGLLGGLVASLLAYKGFGVWSLAVQLIIQYLVRNILLWIVVKWKPEPRFSMKPIKEMFPYSIKLLATALMNQISGNLYSNIIGKSFSLTQAGVYSMGNKFNMISQSTISDGIKNVAFPLLTKVDDSGRRLQVFRKVMRVTAFISFPVGSILIICAQPLISILLTNKWIDVVPILQLLAIGGVVYPLFCLFGAVMQYEGKSGLFFKVEFIKNILLLISIFIAINYGIKELVLGNSIVQIIAFFISAIATGRLISYRLRDVVWDITPYFVVSVVSFAPLVFLSQHIENNYLLLASQLIIGCGLYLGIVKLLGSKVLDDCIEILKKKK